ncbi:thiol:disulfide interchange protein DsbC [Thermovibrio guaymasensis]|uniref:Thiol:disulfide interchange protein DsbC n=1 Tax=Thermovibrio guaymasensis TaxID=240167 RepID=A0A420W7K1_9BACT|nr:thiol:disulfide interchange protein DsbC [Thermovibrio guaymasensis]
MRKKDLLGIILPSLFLSTAYGKCPSPQEASLILSRVTQTITVVTQVTPLPQFKACQVKTESGDTFFLSDDGKWIIEGILIKVPQLVMKEKDRRKLMERALFKIGKGEPLIVLTNPKCRACTENKDKIRKLARRFTLLFVPVGFEKEEFEAAVDAYCRNKNLKDFFKEERGIKVCDRGKLKVWTVQGILKKYGITATPTFILPDGRVIVGVKELMEEVKTEREPF